MADPNDAERARLARLRQIFEHVPFEEHKNKWDGLWEAGDFLPWDRGLPNPALVDALADKTDILGPPVDPDSGQRRKRALVPGCGKGYDVLLLAASGYDAIGLEISDNALAASKEFAAQNWEEYASKSDKYGKGSYSFVAGDFFTDEWRASKDSFDLIYDYTFLCALPPEMRPAWAKRQSQLLSPNGHLICLEFPTTKPPNTGGPPFGLTPDTYVAHLTNPGEKLPYLEDGGIDPSTFSEDAVTKTTNSLALKRVAHWKPERSHAISKGTDFVSIWSHR